MPVPTEGLYLVDGGNPPREVLKLRPGPALTLWHLLGCLLLRTRPQAGLESQAEIPSGCGVLGAISAKSGSLLISEPIEHEGLPCRLKQLPLQGGDWGGGVGPRKGLCLGGGEGSSSHQPSSAGLPWASGLPDPNWGFPTARASFLGALPRAATGPV